MLRSFNRFATALPAPSCSKMNLEKVSSRVSSKDTDIHHGADASSAEKQNVTVNDHLAQGVHDSEFAHLTSIPSKTSAVDEAYHIAGEVALEITKEESDAVRRKIDRRVPILLALVYFSQFLDKTLLNYAAITGLPIKGNQYSIVASGFYFGYLAWVLPTASIAQRFPWGGPTVYLGLNVMAWGVVLACAAINPTFGPFFALRFLLGMLESCVTPILISTVVAFYRAEEQAVRIACFYACNGLTQIVGPLIAYAVTYYTGAAFGYQPWRLLYVVFGLFAFVLGIIVVIWLPASPNRARFLNEHEQRVALERVRDNAAGTTQKKIKWGQLKEAAFGDIRIWFIFLIIILTSIPNGALSNFSSLILKGFGYTSRQTLLIGIPQGVLGILFTVLCAWLSDRYSERILPVLVAIIPTVVGSAILVGLGHGGEHATGERRNVLVFGVYLTSTFGSSLSIIFAWNATNVAGYTKKISSSALMMFGFGAGNIAGSYIFQAKDAPDYIPGKVVILITLAAAAVVAFILRYLVARDNRRKAALIEQVKRERGWDDEEVKRQRDAAAFLDLTDKANIFFRYTS